MFELYKNIANIIVKKLPFLVFVKAMAFPLYAHRIDTFKDKEYLLVTKVKNNRSLYFDRLLELKRFYSKSFAYMIMHYTLNGFPNTNHYKKKMNRFFNEIGTKSEKKLLYGYQITDFMYANRLMLSYHRYDTGYYALEVFKKLKNDVDYKNLHVLDYGCGVADPALFLALNGFKVTVVDLETDKFKFAKHRFAERGLEITAIAATKVKNPIYFPDNIKFDLIIMSEFLEHTYSPRTFLEFALSNLKTGGLFYETLGPVYRHADTGGDHLKEAKFEIEHSDYSSYFLENLLPVNEVFKCDKYKHFYIKIT